MPSSIEVFDELRLCRSATYHSFKLLEPKSGKIFTFYTYISDLRQRYDLLFEADEAVVGEFSKELSDYTALLKKVDLSDSSESQRNLVNAYLDELHFADIFVQAVNGDNIDHYNDLLTSRVEQRIQKDLLDRAELAKLRKTPAKPLQRAESLRSESPKRLPLTKRADSINRPENVFFCIPDDDDLNVVLQEAYDCLEDNYDSNLSIQSVSKDVLVELSDELEDTINDSIKEPLNFALSYETEGHDNVEFNEEEDTVENSIKSTSRASLAPSMKSRSGSLKQIAHIKKSLQRTGSAIAPSPNITTPEPAEKNTKYMRTLPYWDELFNHPETLLEFEDIEKQDGKTEKRVASGSLNRLIQHYLCHFGYPSQYTPTNFKFATVFLRSLLWFVSPEILFDKFIEVFNVPAEIPQSDRNLIKPSVCNGLRFWITKGIMDFADPDWVHKSVSPATPPEAPTKERVLWPTLSSPSSDSNLDAFQSVKDDISQSRSGSDEEKDQDDNKEEEEEGGGGGRKTKTKGKGIDSVDGYEESKGFLKPSLYDRFQKFFDMLNKDTSYTASKSNERSLKITLENKINFEVVKKQTLHQIPDPPPIEDIYKKNFNQLPLNLVADQLTIMEFEILYKIQLKDLQSKRWEKNDQSCPVYQMIEHFNSISYWVVGTILSYHNPAIRAQTIVEFARLAIMLKNRYNFNTMMAIDGALQHTTIERLKKTNNEITEKKRLEINELKQFTASDHNFSSYRKVQKGRVGFCIPYIGLYLRDLIYTEDGEDTWIKGGGIINFDKLISIDESASEIDRCKEMVPTVTRLPKLMAVCKSLLDHSIQEDDLYKLSRTIEPREDPTKQKPKPQPMRKKDTQSTILEVYEFLKARYFPDEITEKTLQKLMLDIPPFAEFERQVLQCTTEDEWIQFLTSIYMSTKSLLTISKAKRNKNKLLITLFELLESQT